MYQTNLSIYQPDAPKMTTKGSVECSQLTRPCRRCPRTRLSDGCQLCDINQPYRNMSHRLLLAASRLSNSA